MSSHHGRQKFILGIMLVFVCFSLYFVNYSEKHDFLSAVMRHIQKLNPSKVLNGSTTVNFANNEDKRFTNLTKVRNGSTVNFTIENKNLSTMPEFPSVTRIPDPTNLTLEERKHNILKLINTSNLEQRIYNSETFGPLTNDTFVVVIQVHLRFEYLELLIESLADAHDGVNDSLIIFSHDVYLPEMNAAIQQINFTRILQIFVPITLQTNPELFPGKTSKSLNGSSIRAKSGSSPFAKQHWWWKAHFLFNKVNVLKKYESVIHFLEEDDYVTPDYIHVMKKLEVMTRENFCFGCNVLIAGQDFYGGEMKTAWKNGTHGVAIVSDLFQPTVNRGLAFNRTLWYKIEAFEKIFCETFKSNNWDYTLMEVSMGYMKTSRLTILAPEARRLFHVGDCGMHFHQKVCNPLPQVRIIKKYIKQFYDALFPETINLSLKFIKHKGWREKGTTSWTEADSKLCLLHGV